MSGGRTRGFDVEDALDRAVELFWRQGYEGTSVVDLTAAMGINPPSMYGAFGSKRQLFDRAVERYMSEREVRMAAALASPTARGAARAVLQNFVQDATTPGQPTGCLMVQGALTCSDANRDVADVLAERRRRTQALLSAVFERAVATGEFRPDVDTAGLARYVATVAVGISVQAATGCTRAELDGVATLAMAALAAAAPAP